LLNRLKEKQEKISRTIESLIEESEKGILIVVEGKKDAEALRSLGANGPILTVKTGGKSLNDAIFEIEKTKSSTVILLLDFDRRGKQTTSRIKESLERTKIKPELAYWLSFQTMLRRDIQCIESLTSYINTLDTKIK
jgi:5S rRNA maturation endonuclease (ribonuclease M5)